MLKELFNHSVNHLMNNAINSMTSTSSISDGGDSEGGGGSPW